MSKKESRSSNKKSKRTKHTSNNKETRKRIKSDDDREQPFIKGEERKVHEEIIQRRIGGGEAPTPEAYARALKQWQQLPGSVIRSPTDVTLPTTRKLPKSQGSVDLSEQMDNKTDNGEKTG
jgi:hypothetical protein